MDLNQTFIVYISCDGRQQLWVMGSQHSGKEDKCFFALKEFRKRFGCKPDDLCGRCGDRVAPYVFYDVKSFVTLNGRPVPADGSVGVDEFGEPSEVHIPQEDGQVKIEVVYEGGE